ncbi:hypothetical protein [Limosilactobacillus reuteri]|uniref:hypothetical protein n=1 Tax=Limosilactobacillus reuteri TaxID=1598 RepID=UPI003F294F3C
MAKYRKTVRGRNPQLGNSLNSLGPHGGILYKNVGTKDNYGIYKNHLAKENSVAWRKYLEMHPHTTLTKKDFLKKRNKQREYHPNQQGIYKKYIHSADGKSYYHFSSNQEYAEWKAQENLVKARKYAQQQASIEYVKQLHQQEIAKRKVAKRYKELQRAEKVLAAQRMIQKKKIKKARERPWRNFVIKTYYYHEKDMILKNDSMVSKSPHYCGSNDCFIKTLKKGKVFIQCDRCKAKKRIPYVEFLMLYYTAKKKNYGE